LTLVEPDRRQVPSRAVEALFEEARRRRRIRRSLALLLVVVVAGTATVSWREVSSKGAAGRLAENNPTDKPFVRIPGEIVAWTGGSVVVLSTSTGDVIRILASGVSVDAPGFSNVSVSPGGTAFFDSAAEAPYNKDLAPGGDQIFSVPITGGPVRDIAAGSDPEVSPNGRLLAFIAADPQDPTGEAPYLVPPVGIDIATLSSGSVREVRTLAPGPAQLDQGASSLSWSADSNRLSYELLNPATASTTSWTVPVDSATTSLAASSQVNLHQRGLSWNGYWVGAPGGRTLGLGVLGSYPGRQEVVTIDPLTGRVAARLLEVPAVVCTGSDSRGSGGCFSDFSDPVIGDGAGDAVLVAGAVPVVDVVEHRGVPESATGLYVWKQGDQAPVLLAGQVLVAAWGPR
jgi:hypothetical protein